jgi:hypothetical protein
MAVGTHEAADGTMVEQLTGTTWTDLKVAGGGALTGVSCVSADECATVGLKNGKLTVLTDQGGAWSSVGVQSDPLSLTQFGSGVSCATVTYCVATVQGVQEPQGYIAGYLMTGAITQS